MTKSNCFCTLPIIEGIRRGLERCAKRGAAPRSLGKTVSVRCTGKCTSLANACAQYGYELITLTGAPGALIFCLSAQRNGLRKQDWMCEASGCSGEGRRGACKRPRHSTLKRCPWCCTICHRRYGPQLQRVDTGDMASKLPVWNPEWGSEDEDATTSEDDDDERGR